MGSSNLHLMMANQNRNTTKKVKSDIRNYERTENNGLVFGSDALQKRMARNGMDGNPKQAQRKRSDLHGVENDGFAFGSQKGSPKLV